MKKINLEKILQCSLGDMTDQISIVWNDLDLTSKKLFLRSFLTKYCENYRKDYSEDEITKVIVFVKDNVIDKPQLWYNLLYLTLIKKFIAVINLLFGCIALDTDMTYSDYKLIFKGKSFDELSKNLKKDAQFIKSLVRYAEGSLDNSTSDITNSSNEMLIEDFQLEEE
ncbi:MAG: hypothetical protein ACPLX8_00060 [Nanopusillaceae archaeon]